jgi:predicted lipid-binding transport protein (Tim44 family)
MMEPEAPGTWAYAAALPVTIVCLALANFVIAYLGGWADVEAGNPAAVAVGFVQGMAGALIAGVAAGQLFKSFRPADFWLKWIVVLAAAVFAVAIVWAMVIGKSDRALTWMTFAGVASLIGTEIGRRIMRALARRSISDEVAARLPD